MNERCHFDHSRSAPELLARLRERPGAAWMAEIPDCDGPLSEPGTRTLHDRSDRAGYYAEQVFESPVCDRHFRAATDHRLVPGATVRVERGRKVPPGTEGRVFWLGQRPAFMQSAYDVRRGRPTMDWIVGLETADGSRAFVRDEYLRVLAPPAAQTLGCDLCDATFTDDPVAGDRFAQRREHDHAAHPRPYGIVVEPAADGSLRSRRDELLWATCPEHGVTTPKIVEHRRWHKNADGSWGRVWDKIVVTEPLQLLREDGSASTVKVQRTSCGQCAAPSVLRVVKLRKPVDPEKLLARARKREVELGKIVVYCSGACVTGKVSCDCFCLGLCHGAANDLFARALEMMSWQHIADDARARGDLYTAAVAERKAVARAQACRGHGLLDVRSFYGAS